MTTLDFYVYLQNGKIIRTGSMPELDIPNNVFEGEKYGIGRVNILNNYIDNGEVCTFPPKPDGEYAFDYDTKQWVFNRETADTKAKQQRDKLLAEGPDRINPMWWSSMTEQEQQAWAFYRQALLDITGQADYPEFIVWPIKP